jgi:hypothetical protein
MLLRTAINSGVHSMSAGQKKTGNPAKQRPPKDDRDHAEKSAGTGDDRESAKFEKVDRPGFDLGGSSGDTEAGKGLGLGSDAKENRKGWRLPR